LRVRFLRVGTVANRVEHPGAVPVLDDDEEADGTVFLVMELLEGETWKDRWSKEGKKLPVDAVLDVALETLDVLVAAHAKGIVHRDIKPDNVFLTRDGKIKILDFGIARLKDGTGMTWATETGATLGTPAFMPPEQARSRWDEVDHRCDLFALAATMWTMLTGRLVHQAKSLGELLIAAANEQAPPISTVMPSLPPRLAEAIDRALRFDRNERWPDAASMRAALAEARLSAKGRSKTLQIEAGAPAPEPEDLEATARTPERPRVPAAFADSVTERRVADEQPVATAPKVAATPEPAAVVAPPLHARLPPRSTPPPVPAARAESEPLLAESEPLLAELDTVLTATQRASVEHAVATDQTAGPARPRRWLAMGLGGAAVACILGLGWRLISPRAVPPEPAATASTTELAKTAAPTASASAAPAESAEVNRGPIVEPGRTAEPPADESVEPRAAPTHAVATPHHPPARPARTNSPSPRDPASIFATH
jgi:serine/threonine-protein kinase